jgi:dihydrofolate reductase
MKVFSVIVACSLNGGIGNDNTIPWYIPDDLKHFKEVTTSCPNGYSNVVIMGKNTWNSLPKKPLPKRINIIISSTLTKDIEYKDTFIVTSFDDALQLSNSLENIHNVFVIGGCKVYNEALQHPLCDRVYVTHILKHIQCSVLFPIVKLFDTFPVCHEGAIHTYNEYSYTFCWYTKK